MTVEILCKMLPNPEQQEALDFLDSLIGELDNAKIIVLHVDRKGNVQGLIFQSALFETPSTELRARLWAIEALWFEDCPYLRDLSPVCGMHKLRALSYYNCPLLRNLPANLCESTNLEVMRLELEHLPPEIESFASLKKLIIYFVKGNISEEIGSLVSLKELEVWVGSGQSIPRSIVNLVNLQRLVIRSYSLTELPRVIGQMTSLKELILAHCRKLRKMTVHSLPLPKLEKLVVNNCSNLRISAKDAFDLNDSLVQVSLKGSVLDETRSSLDLIVRLNKAGRGFLRQKAKVPQALWSHLLARCCHDTDSLYFFLLQKPELS